jgi:hypothetical protein
VTPSAQFPMTRKAFPVISLSRCALAFRDGEEPRIARMSRINH